MKRLAIAALAATSALPAALALAADQEITAAPVNRYTTSGVTIDQGNKVTFRNTDVANHDVVSDAPGPEDSRLFRSDTIGQGTSAVRGVEYLTAGSYGYFCSSHPNMTGTLTVTSAGTPAQRPGTGTAPPPAADTTAPVFKLTAAKSYKASSLKRSQAVRFTLATDEGATVALTVKIGTVKAGTLEVEFGGAGSRKVEVFLSSKGRRALKKGRRLSISARGSDTAGNEAKASYSSKLR